MTEPKDMSEHQGGDHNSQKRLQGRAYDQTDPRSTADGSLDDPDCGLAARAPYFHNGSARTLEEVLDSMSRDLGSC
jgi:cytochrome c peroxidase